MLIFLLEDPSPKGWENSYILNRLINTGILLHLIERPCGNLLRRMSADWDEMCNTFLHVSRVLGTFTLIKTPAVFFQKSIKFVEFHISYFNNNAKVTFLFQNTKYIWNKIVTFKFFNQNPRLSSRTGGVEKENYQFINPNNYKT